jgi:hypothetical protein
MLLGVAQQAAFGHAPLAFAQNAPHELTPVAVRGRSRKACACGGSNACFLLFLVLDRHTVDVPVLHEIQRAHRARRSPHQEVGSPTLRGSP